MSKKKSNGNQKNLSHFIDKTASQDPSSIAIYTEEEALTYAEVSEASDLLAYNIHCIQPNTCNIVIFMKRSADAIIALLAVMKSDNTYIPIDFDAKSRQFEQIINDCKPSILLTNELLSKEIESILEKYNVLIIHTKQKNNILNKIPKPDWALKSSNRIAYILYTSGTTGIPKGVQISHDALINFIFSMGEKINFSRHDTFLAITPITFDISAAEIYLPLLTGAKLVFADNKTRYEPQKLEYFISKFNVSFMQATPITWQMLVEAGWRNESKIKIICGGEALSTNLAHKLNLISSDIWNFYGPTETTVWSTYYKLSEEIDETHPVVSIGKPIANTQVYVLDKKLQKQPIGEPGELYIGGAGVALGYLNRPELNQTCFITNPFSAEKNETLYKTGDLVVQDSEGFLHYLGRIDTQIKIRGHRIEASAIENVLMDCQGIKECAVLDKNPEKKHELVAYLILSEDITLPPLQNHLKTHFPQYMIPTCYVVVDAFPVTANGKIDRKCLPDVRPFHYLGDQTCERVFENKYEEILVDLIQSYLQRKDIDPESNFFDLGLHSLLLVNLSQALNRILNQSISVVDLFEHPTVRDFAQYLMKHQQIDYLNSPKSDTEQNRPSYLHTSHTPHHIAVVGMACKVPGADNYHDFWQLILQKKEAITRFDQSMLNEAWVSSLLYQRADYVPARGILRDIDKFDAKFFGYTPAEARLMDPQHRLFLQQAWSAFEDAGYAPSAFKGKVAVYAGMNDSSYLTNHLLQNPEIKANYDTQQLLLATSTHYLATKVAYALGLTGPSVTVNTACSTGLVSVAMACNSLMNHDCDMALAGAVTIVTPQQTGYVYQELGILSPDGHCRVFDANAQGTVLSNGCGMVVLRRLDDALKDNDNILAVLKGWAVNNDGHHKVGFTAPSVEGQVSCVKEALARAEISPTEIEYIEAHGTGTLMGDPIEIASLSQAYAHQRDQPSQYCALGSIKANLGHTDSASGIIGLIKTTLVLYHQTLPPQINYTQANPNIDFEHSPFFVNDETKPWETKYKKRTAAVHALGFGGTNAHVIVQEAPVVKTTHSKRANLIVLSAKSAHSLQAMTQALRDHLLYMIKNKCNDSDLADLAYTLQIGRSAFEWRIAFAYQSNEQLIQILNTPQILKQHTKHQAKKTSRIIFGFTGQGSQYAGMAADMYQEHPYFKQIVDECCDQLQPHLEIDLRHILFPKSPREIEFANTQLRQTQFTQPTLFIIEYALAKFLMALGIQPDALIGHSLGEYVAATLAGVLSSEDALDLVTKRAKLMARTESAAMLVVPLSLEKIQPYLHDHLELAVHNAPNLCVVAGSSEAIAAFTQVIQSFLEDGVACKMLHTSHAFHSRFMEPISNELNQLSLTYRLSEPKIPYISNVSGDWITREELMNQAYWGKHLRQTVQFSKGLQSLNLQETDIFIEIGPGQVLTQLIQQHKLPKKPLILNTLPAADKSNPSSYAYFLGTIGQLWLQHLSIHWEHLYTHEIRQRRALPTYVFEEQSYWIEPGSLSNKISESAKNNIKSPGMDKTNPVFYQPIWVRDKKLSLLTSTERPPIKRCVILFCDDESLISHSDIFSSFSGSRENEAEDVYIVSAGSHFQTINRCFVLNPQEKEDYRRCLDKIGNHYDEYAVIHTWLFNPQHILNQEQMLAKGAYGLLYLTQVFNEQTSHDGKHQPSTSPQHPLIRPNEDVLGGRLSEKRLKVLVVTNQLFSVLGDEEIVPSKATILGPCKVIPQEQDNIVFKVIDLESKQPWTPLCIKQLAWELDHMTPTSFKEEIAYRGAYRWIKKLEPCDEEIKAAHSDRFKQQGVYLITGGLGGVGLSIAAYLAENYQAHIILIARRVVDFQLEAQESADTMPDMPTQAEKIHLFKRIQKYAKSLTIEQAFIEDMNQLTAVIQSIKHKFPMIHGVIHAAGVAGGGVAQLKQLETYEAVLKPKLQGTANLMHCLKHEPMDFMMLVSSVTSITGFPGQIDYCSANSVLDAYAHKRDNFTHPVFCVVTNWLAWREVGMAATSQTMLLRLDEHNSIGSQEGCDLFGQIVNAQFNQVVISKEDLNHYQPPNLSIEILDCPLTETQDVIHGLLTLWQQILGIHEIDIDDDFYDLGGHSLLAVSLLSKIRQQFKVKIPSTLLFHVKTIRGLATMIESYRQENEDFSPLVVLRQGEPAKPPLFLFHPVGGTVFCYMQLASLLETDRTVYAFQDPSIEAEKSLFSTIEEMAIFYLNHIKNIQNHGPYYLAGASFGSLLAIEIAHRLEQQGENVHFVGVMDGWGKHDQEDVDMDYVKQIINLHHPKHQADPKLDKQSLWESLLLQRLNMMQFYLYRSIQSNVILFKAQDLLPEYASMDAADNHWSAFIANLTVIMSPGDHNTMLQAPDVENLAKKMSTYLI